MPTAPPPGLEPTTCTTDDGIAVAAYDFGGSGPDLLLVHATGFCAGVLAPLAAALADRFRCWALDLRGHGSSGRPGDADFGWDGFARDVLAVVDGLGLDRPFGFGHSCGGAALLLAEQARPGTFAGLYLFEPVVVPDGLRADLGDQNPLAAGARRRRATFPSSEDAFVNFSSKPPLAGLDPEALRHYVEDGFEPVPADEGGDGVEVRLRCRREDEAAIFDAGSSHDAFAHLGAVGCPVTLAYGERSDTLGRAVMEADVVPLPDGRLEAYAGLGHFGPLERPAEVARGMVRALLPSGGTPRS